VAKTKTAASIAALNLTLPPEGGSLSLTTSLEEDAHYLRVTLDKSENFKVAVGVRLRDLLTNKFANNRNALRDWHEENVVQGKEHRAWSTVDHYLGAVLRHGEAAGEILAKRDQRTREHDSERYRTVRTQARAFREGSLGGENANENNGVPGQRPRLIKSEYDLRKEWLSDMNHLWFKGSREWQGRWLKDRRLSRDRGSD
jgi:hypothetical protein